MPRKRRLAVRASSVAMGQDQTFPPRESPLANYLSTALRLIFLPELNPRSRGESSQKGLWLAAAIPKGHIACSDQQAVSGPGIKKGNTIRRGTRPGAAGNYGNQ